MSSNLMPQKIYLMCQVNIPFSILMFSKHIIHILNNHAKVCHRCCGKMYWNRHPAIVEDTLK
jgi:hypothetical protein